MFELSLLIRLQVCWELAVQMVADSWALWIRAERRQNGQSSEVEIILNSSESQNRKELQSASAAQAVR